MEQKVLDPSEIQRSEGKFEKKKNCSINDYKASKGI